MAETQVNLPPHLKNLPTQTIPLHPFTPTSTLGELIACFRHRCPGYNRQTYPYDTETDPVLPLVVNGVREAATITSGCIAKAAATKSRVGLGVRFHAQPGMIDAAVDELLSARRPGVPLSIGTLSAIAYARHHHDVPFRDEYMQTDAFRQEVFMILNTILRNSEELLQDAVRAHPFSSWRSFGYDTQDAIAHGLSYYDSCEDKTAFVALSASSEELGVFEQFQRLAGDDGRMGASEIGKVLKATKVAKITRKILQYAMVLHPQLVVLGAYTQFMFLRIIPPSETLVETQIFVSRIYRRYPTGAHWIQATDDLQCDLTKVSITSALLAVSLRRVDGEAREWELAYVWPSASDICAWKAEQNRGAEVDGATAGGGGGGGTGGENDGPRSHSRLQESHVHSIHQMALIVNMPTNLVFPKDCFRLCEVTCRRPVPIARPTRPLPSRRQTQPVPSVSGPSTLSTIDGKTTGSAMPLLDLQFSAVLGRGHLGQVFRATLRDESGAHDVAVKVVVPGRLHFVRQGRDSGELTFDEAEAAILHEARVYHVLSDYQGSLIPKTFGLWKGRLIEEFSFPTVYGDLDAYLLIMECLETGSTPSVEEVESRYRALHAAGVVHVDASLRNYRDGRILDLEMAILSPALGSVPGTEHSQKLLDLYLFEEYDHPPNDQDRLKKWEELAQEELEDVRRPEDL